MKIFIFWLLSLTRGLILTLIGGIIALGLLVTGHKPKLFNGLVYFEIGDNWGGFNAGAFFFVQKHAPHSTKQHEAGHSLQNIVFGFLMPFIVTIPSVIRYHYRNYLVSKKGKQYYELPDYDSMWFEGWATRLGEKYFPIKLSKQPRQ